MQAVGIDDARRAGDEIGLNWAAVPLASFHAALTAEITRAAAAGDPLGVNWDLARDNPALMTSAVNLAVNIASRRVISNLRASPRYYDSPGVVLFPPAPPRPASPSPSLSPAPGTISAATAAALAPPPDPQAKMAPDPLLSPSRRPLIGMTARGMPPRAHHRGLAESLGECAGRFRRRYDASVCRPHPWLLFATFVVFFIVSMLVIR